MLLLLLFLLQLSMNMNVTKQAVNNRTMRPGPKIDHHYMKAMLYERL